MLKLNLFLYVTEMFFPLPPLTYCTTLKSSPAQGPKSSNPVQIASLNMFDDSYNEEGVSNGGSGDKRYHSSFESSGKSNDDTNEEEEIPFSYYDAASAALKPPQPIPVSTTPTAPYREGEQVLYTNKNDESTCLVVIQKVHYDDLLQPY